MVQCETLYWTLQCKLILTLRDLENKHHTLSCNARMILKCQLLYFWRTEEIEFDHVYPSEIYFPNKNEWYEIQKSYAKVLSLPSFSVPEK